MKADFNSSIKEIDHICVMDDFDSMTLPPGIAPPGNSHMKSPPPQNKIPRTFVPHTITSDFPSGQLPPI